jgi:hypothetical protein
MGGRLAAGLTPQNVLILWTKYLSFAFLGHWVCWSGSLNRNVCAVRVSPGGKAKTWFRRVTLSSRFAPRLPLHIGQAWQAKVVTVVVIVAVLIVPLHVVRVPVLVRVGQKIDVGLKRRRGRWAGLLGVRGRSDVAGSALVGCR